MMRRWFNCLCSAALCLMIAGVNHAARAQVIIYDLQRDMNLRSCDQQRYAGRALEADACYAEVFRTAADPFVKAQAIWARGDLKTANRLFREVVTANPDDPYVRTRWGYLYITTHQDQDALTLFEEALELDEEFVPAMVGAATVLAQRFDNESQALISEILQREPDRIEAHLLTARIALEAGDLESTGAALDKAGAAIAATNFPHLEIYALKAAMALVQEQPADAWIDKALAENPGYAEIFVTLAHFYEVTRRYEEAAGMLRRAVAIKPDHWQAHARLAINLLRTNHLTEAQQHLQLAYSGDPYSPSTVNTLRLLDSFKNFSVSKHKVHLPEATVDYSLRLHNDEADVLRPYAVKIIERGIHEFSQRYGFIPRNPIVIELFPDHDDFAVRVDGMPGIGLLGVTFGYLIAMDSPAGRQSDTSFHWGSVLWHELAHVYTLEITHHLVPRWFSEGVSVYEEWRYGPVPKIHIPLEVFQAMKEDLLLPVADLDAGFIRPSYESQIIVSYMQAGLVCYFIAQRWGEAAMVQILDAYASGASSVEAIQRILALSPVEFDTAFNAFVRQRFSAMLDNFDEWLLDQTGAMDSLQNKDWTAAIDYAQQAIDIYPNFIGDDSPLVILALAFEATGQHLKALQAMEDYWRYGGVDRRYLRKLAHWLDESGRRDTAIEVLSAINYSAPLDESLHARLGDWLLDQNRADEAIVEYQAVLATKPHDVAAAHFNLAKAYQRNLDMDNARNHLLLALEAAPHYREAQQMLLDLVR